MGYQVLTHISVPHRLPLRLMDHQRNDGRNILRARGQTEKLFILFVTGKKCTHESSKVWLPKQARHNDGTTWYVNRVGGNLMRTYPLMKNQTIMTAKRGKVSVPQE